MAWYKFDECSGTVAHSTNETNNSALNGTITIGATLPQSQAGTCSDGLTTSAWYNGVTGKLSSSINLDGSDDYVTTANVALLASNAATYTTASWGTWARPLSSVSKTLVQKNNEFRLTTDANGYPACQIYSSSWQTGATYNTALPVASWSHLLCTYDGANIKLYLNGALKATQPQTGAITSSSATALNVGRDSGGTGYFYGKLDDARVYNYALSAVAIKTLYTDGAVKF